MHAFPSFRFLLMPLCLALSLTASACDYREFDKYAKEAPIRVYDAPKNYRTPGFGKPLVTFTTGNDDGRSVAVASAGRDSPVVFTRMWDGGALRDATFVRCRGKEDCKDSAGVGNTLIAFPIWALDTPQEESGCVLAPGQPKAFVFCDSNTSVNQSYALNVGDVADSESAAFFGGAGLPPAHPLGVALLGAYAVSNRSGEPANGRLFYQPDFQPKGGPSDDDEVPELEALPLTDPETGELFADAEDAGDLGYAIALDADADGNLLIAVAQPALERVIVASYDSGKETLTTRACIESPDGAVRGFGKQLVVGDVNQDGVPEVVVGTDAAESAERVWLYRGVSLPDAEAAVDTCPGWDEDPIEVTCMEGLRDVTCEDSAFGSALALGDIDGDGYRDLIVGAPNAKVGSTKEVGAVWIFPGGDDSPPDGGLNFGRATNLFAHKKSLAHVGSSVAALHTKDRDEPVAGAPGEDRLYVFMCSSLEENVSNRSLCLPK